MVSLPSSVRPNLSPIEGADPIPFLPESFPEDCPGLNPSSVALSRYRHEYGRHPLLSVFPPDFDVFPACLLEDRQKAVHLFPVSAPTL